MDDTYFLIPVNVKYSISTPVESLKVIPYAGITLSMHTQEVGVFGTMYNEVYDPESTFPNLVVTDTSSIIRIGRPSNNNILLNAGANIEYQVLNWLVVSLSGNFTFGFTDLNRIEVEVLKPEGTEYGDIIYRGNKFYLAAGLKIPFGL